MRAATELIGERAEIGLVVAGRKSRRRARRAWERAGRSWCSRRCRTAAGRSAVRRSGLTVRSTLESTGRVEEGEGEKRP
jgi:hypothetical protein